MTPDLSKVPPCHLCGCVPSAEVVDGRVVFTYEHAPRCRVLRPTAYAPRAALDAAVERWFEGVEWATS